MPDYISKPTANVPPRNTGDGPRPCEGGQDRTGCEVSDAALWLTWVLMSAVGASLISGVCIAISRGF